MSTRCTFIQCKLISCKLSLLALISVITPEVLAQPFSWQLSADYNEVHPGTIDGATLAARYYLAPVATNQGPLQQAAFLQRSSSVGVMYRDDSALTVETDSYGIFGRYVAKQSGWFVGGQYSDSDGSQDTSGGNSLSRFSRHSDIDGNDYQFTVGRYLLENTTLGIAYQYAEIDQSDVITSSPVGVCSFVSCLHTTNSNIKFDNKTYTINLKHFSAIEGLDYLLTLSYSDTESKIRTEINASISPSLSLPPSGLLGASPEGADIAAIQEINSVKNDSSSYAIGAKLYPTKRVAVGMGFSSFDNDATDPETYTINAEWFFLPAVAVNFSYSKTNYGNRINTVRIADNERYSLGVLVRF